VSLLKDQQQSRTLHPTDNFKEEEAIMIHFDKIGVFKEENTTHITRNKGRHGGGCKRQLDDFGN
jgi:hypothetical protein